MSLLRALLAAVAAAIALILQVTLFPYFAFNGVVPNLCLLVVVAAALTRGPQFAMLLGFVAGLLLDLAPPADHVAGRWALALVVVGYVAGRVRRETQFGIAMGPKPPALAVVASVAVCSLLGTSLFCFSGLLLGDLGVGFAGLMQVILIGVAWDVLLTPFVLPPLMLLLNRSETRDRDGGDLASRRRRDNPAQRAAA